MHEYADICVCVYIYCIRVCLYIDVYILRERGEKAVTYLIIQPQKKYSSVDWLKFCVNSYSCHCCVYRFLISNKNTPRKYC